LRAHYHRIPGRRSFAHEAIESGRSRVLRLDEREGVSHRGACGQLRSAGSPVARGALPPDDRPGDCSLRLQTVVPRHGGRRPGLV